MKANLLLFASSAFGRSGDGSSINDNDAIFNTWCKDVGIVSPGAEVRTTPLSVAGRGVFSTKDLVQGEEVISIPHHTVMTQYNCEKYFPTLASKLSSAHSQADGWKSKMRRLRRNIWNQTIRRRPALGTYDRWQVDLTAYSLEAIEQEHPWSTWILQWTRDDPLQRLVDSTVTTTRMTPHPWKNDAIEATIADFHTMSPDISQQNIGAAIAIRLNELYEYSSTYKNRGVPISESLYCTLMSRAVGLSDDVAAVIPMHDMINHSSSPNLCLSFDVTYDESATFKLFALEDIPKDTELLLRYKEVTEDDGKWNEEKATWLLAHWGIPSSPSDFLVMEHT
jgi:hypothetical protein